MINGNLMINGESDGKLYFENTRYLHP